MLWLAVYLYVVAWWLAWIVVSERLYNGTLGLAWFIAFFWPVSTPALLIMTWGDYD